MVLRDHLLGFEHQQMGPNLLRFKKLGTVFSPETDHVAKVEQLVAVHFSSGFSALGGQNVSEALLLIDKQITKSVEQLGPFSKTPGPPNRLSFARSRDGLDYLGARRYG